MEEDDIGRMETEPAPAIGADDDVTVALEAELEVADTEDEPLELDEEDPNLVPLLKKTEKGREFLEEVMTQVLELYQETLDSTEAFRQQVAEDWKLFQCDIKKKNYPWKNSANIHVPLVLENISLVATRTYGELFGDWTNVFSVLPTGPDDQEVAEILSFHGNWQIREQIPDFRRQQMRGVLLFYMQGTVTAHSYYDAGLKQNRHEMLTVDQFMVPYTHVSTMPDYSDCPFYFYVDSYYRKSLQAYRGVWAGVEDLLERSGDAWVGEDDDPKMAVSNAESSLIQIPDARKKNQPYRLVTFNGWLELPGHDRDRWCEVIIHKPSNTCLMFRIYEEPSWEERARYSKQQMEATLWAQQREEYFRTKVGLEEQIQQLLASGLQSPELAAGIQMQVQQLQMQSQQMLEPDPPAWAEGDFAIEEGGVPKPLPMERKQICPFSHAVCIESLTGVYGLSYGKMQAAANVVVNTLMNQFVDAAHLANAPPTFVAGPVDIPKGLEFAPGKFIKIYAPGSELRDSLMPFQPPPANTQLVQVAEMMMGLAKSSIGAADVLSGAEGKSGEAYRGLQARIEQATKRLSVVSQNYIPFLEAQLRRNAYLNSVYLKDEELFSVVDHKSQELREFTLSRDMYVRDYRTYVRADMKYNTEAAKIAQADETLQMPNIIRSQLGPVGAQADLNAFVWDVTAKALKARDDEQLLRALGPRPADPQEDFQQQQQMMMAQAQAMAMQQQQQQQMGGGQEGMPPQEGMPQEGMPQEPAQGPQQ